MSVVPMAESAILRSVPATGASHVSLASWREKFPSTVGVTLFFVHDGERTGMASPNAETPPLLRTFTIVSRVAIKLEGGLDRSPERIGHGDGAVLNFGADADKDANLAERAGIAPDNLGHGVEFRLGWRGE